MRVSNATVARARFRLLGVFGSGEKRERNWPENSWRSVFARGQLSSAYSTGFATRTAVIN